MRPGPAASAAPGDERRHGLGDLPGPAWIGDYDFLPAGWLAWPPEAGHRLLHARVARCCEEAPMSRFPGLADSGQGDVTGYAVGRCLAGVRGSWQAALMGRGEPGQQRWLEDQGRNGSAAPRR